MASALIERYDDRISGVLSCYDRVVVTGTLPTVCYADGMTRFLYARQILIFGYPDFAVTLRDKVREAAASVASQAGVCIEHIAKSHVRKEAIVAQVLEQRGEHPGLVHVISAMEACDAYKPWHDKQTHRTYLRPDSGKCLHYYFYFMDAELGLVYLRVPTYCPFRLQFYCNGHSWLARRLAAEGIGFTMADNAFARIDDWQRAQDLADEFSPDLLHRVLDRYAAQCCPVLEVFGQTYHWSLMQVEYATDLVFRSTATLGPLYEQLTRQSVLSVKAEQIATFLGRQITLQLAQELGSQFSTRIEGTCIKHRFGAASIKMYDKFGQILRIETTSAALNDVFLSGTPEEGVLFQFTVTKAWLRQVIVALPLICHSSYRGVIEFLRDLLGIPVSLGTVHDVLQSAARQADVINEGEDLSGIRVGLHDEIFQGGMPVLAGVDAGSTYCYLLVAAEHRDANTWGVHQRWCMCGRPLGCKRQSENSDGRIDCDHVYGLLARLMTAGPDGVRDPVPNTSATLESLCTKRVLWIIGSTDRHLI